MFYSVIIPVYNNNASDIKRCIDSFTQSTLKELEILIMDDGSTRKCAQDIDRIIAEYPVVTVYHLSHGGAAKARNEGIRLAKGKYICFADADDMVTKQFLFDLSAIEQSKIDYDVVYGLVSFIKKGSEIKESDQLYPLTVNKIGYKEYCELYRHMFDLGAALFKKESGYVSRGPVARIVKREIAKRNLFNTNLVLGEDELWNLDLLEATNNLAVVYHKWYLYIENPLSTSRKPNPDFVGQHRDLLVSMLPYMKKHEGSLEGAFANRVFESLHEIIIGFYLTSLNKEGILKSMKRFNKMVSSFPYNILTYKYAKMGGIKTLIKFGLLKMGCLLLGYKIKYIILRS